MHLLGLVSLSLAISVSALPGLLHDEAHHTHEVLDNLHQTPHCAYRCIFRESYKEEWAPDCADAKEGKETGACYCRADAYQYIIDQCWERSCNPKGRKKTREMNVKSCEHYGVKEDEMYKLEKIKGAD